MASHPEQPPPAAPPRAQTPAPPAPTTIRALSEDLLREILLRLPSLPSLVRAALTCRAFLAAVRSSAAFRRRFRELHPAPLLGFFYETGDEISSFAPLRRRSDPDLAAAVRGVEAFRTRLPCDDDVFSGWVMLECRGGYLLLRHWRTDRIAVYNPLTGALDLLPTPPHKVSNGHRGKFIPMEYDYFLLSSGAEAPDRSSFRVVSVSHDKSRLRAAVFSLATRDWRILPWSEPAPSQPARGKYWLLRGTQVNGFLCWAHACHAYMVMLDTATLQFSFIDLPEVLKGQGHLYYQVGEAKEGEPCIVAAIEFTLVIWRRRAGPDGADKWMLDNMIRLEQEVLRATEGSLNDHEQLKVWAILDGIVYMSTSETLRDATVPRWNLSFCLETRKLEKLLYTKIGGQPHPYIMDWPTSLVGSN